MSSPILHEDIAKELNEQDWKVLFSFGYSGRYIKVWEIMEEQAIIPTIKLNKRGLLDYFKDPNVSSNSYYGLNENGVSFIGSYMNQLPKTLLFGAKVKTE